MRIMSPESLQAKIAKMEKRIKVGEAAKRVLPGLQAKLAEFSSEDFIKAKQESLEKAQAKILKLKAELEKLNSLAKS